MSSSALYFKIEREWPEGYASVGFHKKPSANVSHLDIYKATCGPDYLRHFEITEFSDGEIPDFLPNNFGWPVVSSRCCERFLGIDADVKATSHSIRSLVNQRCPAELKDYFLLSASVALDCLDLTNESLRWHGEGKRLVASYEYLRLVASQIPPRVSFFGIKRMPCLHVVSDELRNSLCQMNLTGVSFRPCEVVAQ
jgi:hypothetical protein